jgi:hypothetical protein
MLVFQSLLRRLQAQPLRDLGTKSDVEVGLADPHPVKNARELSRNRGNIACSTAWQFADPTPATPTIS